ncbi:MAG TPA: hypothetical protein VK177_01455 [Flavobacteriales bacterium]|nr:hypothetical protein [Flavobacteriales bacterium]
MKKIITTCCFLIAAKISFSQNVGINSTGVAPNVSAMLDVVALDKGLLIPRVSLTSTTDAVTIPTPATSLLVYNLATAGVSPNNVVPGYYYNSNTAAAPVWVRLATGNGPSWLLTGNAGTTASTAAYGAAVNNNFIGTIDARDWVMATNNLERARILTGGQFAIGTKLSTNNAILNVVSSVASTSPYSNSTLYLQGPGQNGFGLSGVVDIFDNQATPQREAMIGYSVGSPWYGMMSLYGSSAGTEQRMGEFDFMNRVLQPADARIATIVANTPAGVSNSGSLEFITRNAGTFVSNALWINFDGRTAIGNRAPVSKFDVEGNVSIGTSYAGSIAAPANGLIVEGNTGLGVSNPAYNTEINGTFGYGNGTAGVYRSRTETRNDAGLMASQSGFYETSAPAPAANWPTGASSWWHLLDIRHSNNANNYALQFSGSFFDQNLYFRKTNNNAAQAWSQVLTSTSGTSNAWLTLGNAGTNAATNFIGTTDGVDWVMRTSNIERARITAGGNYGIGIAVPTQRLDVQGGNGRINNAFIGDVGHGAGWGGISHSQQNTTTGYALIESNDGAYTLINKLNTGTGYIGFRVSNVDQAVITNAGNMGIQTTNPQVRLAVNGAGTNVYATDAWIENNMHLQGNEVLMTGDRGRLRVGTAWNYVGMYADASSTGLGNDLVLGASSGTTRIGCNGCTTQNLLVNGTLTVYPTSNTFNRIISGGAGSYLGIYTDALYTGTATAPTFLFDGMTLSSVGTTFGDVSYSSENTGGWHYWMIGGTRRMRLTQTNQLLLNTGTFNTTGADVAEEFTHDGSLEEGDVVMIDAEGENEIKKCDKPKSSKVFGVISTTPGVILNSINSEDFDRAMEKSKPKTSEERAQKWDEFQKEHKKSHLPVALNGRTPCKVVSTSGKIKKGDFITSSSRAGYGEKLVGAGSYFGIALEDDNGTGKIMIVMKSGYTNE